ncbi:hypothetical protein LTR36_007616 [Oleoguttula mirabilis]|uniref:Methyltransferase type 11 domain-containing protein n=1 Tax=Oleoguttula mirabilis TaxID=1507867 RepID=A0AAV9JUE6_9PEZI|nr:hypothetical protein LTR36_007616 [Oleoguttula mirabilis]
MATTPRDPTFRVFTAEQAAAYASGRAGSYPDALYQSIMNFHHGKRELCLDVGTGPGKAVWDLLNYFDRCIGCDAGAEMIEQAKKDAARLGVTDRAAFVLAPAESCADTLAQPNFPPASADVITVAMAAHWFDLPAFYASAAQALRPGGTLAMWTASSYYCHPAVPNHEAIQRILTELEDGHLADYMAEGNKLTRGGYEQLPLPWSSSNNEPSSGLFDETSFQRRDWDRDGVPSAPALADGTPGPFLLGKSRTMEQAIATMSSSGPVIRWRQAHPEKAETEEDPLMVTEKRLREIMDGADELVGSPSCSLLLMRRKD